MQYIDNVVGTKSLVFTKPCNGYVGDAVKFVSYGTNFEVLSTAVIDVGHFVIVKFAFTAAEVAKFVSGTEWRVQFGDVQDYVVGDRTPSEVVEYVNEDE